MKRRNTEDPVRVATVLEEVLDRYGLSAALSKHNLVNLWPKVVDERVLRHAKAEKVAGSVLHVIVDSSVWMNELSGIKTVLLEKLNAHLSPEASPLTDIRFQQRSWAKQEPAETVMVSPPPPPSRRDEARVRQAIEPVKDPKLQRVFKRLMEKDRQLKHRRPD